jgi:hypothetical protein
MKDTRLKQGIARGKEINHENRALEQHRLETGHATDFLVGGGEMAERMRAMDWSRTALGPMEQWPQSLKTSGSICLASRFPIVMHWGPQYMVLYNDAYSTILGSQPFLRGVGIRGMRERREAVGRTVRHSVWQPSRHADPAGKVAPGSGWPIATEETLGAAS